MGLLAKRPADQLELATLLSMEPDTCLPFWYGLAMKSFGHNPYEVLTNIFIYSNKYYYYPV